MASKLLSRRDVEFLLYEWLDVAALCGRPRFADHSRETFDSALDTAERIAADLFLPHRHKSDVEEPFFDGERVHLIPEVRVAFDAFAQAGLLAAAQDYGLGGMQLPSVVDKACLAYFYAANVGSAGYPSQFLSALLMVAPYAQNPIEITLITELNSKPYVDMTISMMKDFGVEIERYDYSQFIIHPSTYLPIPNCQIESDASAASYFFAAPAICGGTIKVENISRKSVQGDVAFLEFSRKWVVSSLKRITPSASRATHHSSALTSISATSLTPPKLSLPLHRLPRLLLEFAASPPLESKKSGTPDPFIGVYKGE